MKAPRSIEVVPNHTRCEMIRLSSQAMTRRTLQRSVISMSISFSTARAKHTLLDIGAR